MQNPHFKFDFTFFNFATFKHLQLIRKIHIILHFPTKQKTIPLINPQQKQKATETFRLVEAQAPGGDRGRPAGALPREAAGRGPRVWLVGLQNGLVLLFVWMFFF